MSSENIQQINSLGLQLYEIKRLWHRCFPMIFPKYLRAPILTLPKTYIKVLCYLQSEKI